MYFFLALAAIGTVANGAALSASPEDAALKPPLRITKMLQREIKPEQITADGPITELLQMERKSEQDATKGPTANSEFAKEVLKEHTKARKERKASNMMHLMWDQDLADLAAKHANKCIYEHGTLYLPDGTIVGQNIATAVWSEAAGEFPPAAHVANWMMELQYFNNRTATCDEMGDCGHYSQMVWAMTSKVGCAHKFCPKVNGGSDMIVCNYSPFGNGDGSTYNTDGSPCSECNLKGGTACVEGQCVDCKQNPELVANHECKSCDPSLCKDEMGSCGAILEDICNHQMMHTFAMNYCRKFCNLCEC